MQHVQPKSVVGFQPTKLLISESATVKSAKPDLTCLKLHLRNRNRHYFTFKEMVHIVLQEKRVATAKKTIFFFEQIAPPATIKQN